jgi:anti-sigma B factor antagonist
VPFSTSVEGSRPAVVRLAGELDIATAAELHSRLATIEGDIELDCSRLEFVDAAGLGVFVSAHKRLDGQGWKFVLVEPTPLLVRLLSVTGLDASLNVRSDAGSPR